jgi:HEAT repeat protein
MSRPGRKRIFGPLLYSTVTIAVIVTLVVQIETGWPLVAEWLREQSLTRSLHGADASAREEAVAELLQNGSAKARAYLLEAAHDSRAEQRALACRQLITSGVLAAVVVPILVASANDADPNVRHEAAQALGRLVAMGAPLAVQFNPSPARDEVTRLRAESLQALHLLLKDQEGFIRLAAALALGAIGTDPKTAAALARATEDPDRDVRMAVAGALLKVSGPNDRAAGRVLAALVADREPISDRRAVLGVVMSADQHTQDLAAAALAASLADADTSTVPDIMECLLAMGPRARAAAPALERFLKEEDPIQRASATIALATIGGKSIPGVIPGLIAVIGDPGVSTESRYHALEKLQELDATMPRKATPPLIRQLASPDFKIRQAALSLLSGIIAETPAELPASEGTQLP